LLLRWKCSVAEADAEGDERDDAALATELPMKMTMQRAMATDGVVKLLQLPTAATLGEEVVMPLATL
jgi:hypothetical protein